MSDDRTEWLEWRRQGIGASDVAAIIGLSNWSSPWKIYAEKVGLLPIDGEMSERQQMGLDLEVAISKMFTRKTGLVVAGEQTWCMSPTEPWARCTVDGFVFEGMTDEIDLDAALGGYEAKSDGRFGWPDGIPPNYQAQGQFGMFVTGMPRWWFAVLHAGLRFEVYELERDDEDIYFLVAKARDFWRDNCLTGVPPDVDGSDATLEALASVYPDAEPGLRVDITELVDEVALWRLHNADRLDAEKREKEAKAKIIAALGSAELGCVDGVPAVSLRKTHKEPYTVAAQDYRVLRIASKKDQKENSVGN